VIARLWRWRLPRGSVAANLAVVGGATLLGQGALVVAAPILARLYDPEAFGLMSVYTAVLFVLLSVSSLRFDFAIPIARDRAEALNLLGVSAVLGLAMSAIVALIVAAAGSQIASLLGAVELGPLLWVLPLSLAVASTTQALTAWAVFDRSFSAIGRLRATQGGSQAVGQVALGLTRVGPLGLIIGDFASRAIGAATILHSVAGSLRSWNVSAASMARATSGAWAFARVMTVASLLSALALQLPFLLIPLFFDLDASGQYFLAYRLLVLPASLIAAAFSQVFLGEAAARQASPHEFHRFATDAAVALLIFAIPTYGMVMVLGQEIITAAFGEEWALAGRFAQIIAPWLLLWSVASPISSLLLLGRRELESLAFTAVGLAMGAAAITIGAVAGSLTLGIAILSIGSSILTVGSLWRFLRVAGAHLSELAGPAARILGLSALPIVAAFGVASVIGTAVLPAAAVGWLIALAAASRRSRELQNLLSSVR
jgi:O-antigen/teichoic acid export membrane protein